MMLALRRGGLEMTADGVFAHRVRRLGTISVVAPGVIWGLAVMDGAPGWSLVLLGAGWILMPAVLAVSIHRPVVRYGLLVPAVLIPIGLAGMASVAADPTAIGWIVLIGGVVLGGFLGLWFWFRWLPVPWSLNDPFGWSRVVLVGVHVGLVLAGAAIIAAGV